MWGEACSAMAARRRRRWASLAAALGAVSLLLLVAFYGGRLRCRHGYFHVVNNDYTHCHWEMYAIGGSAEPTINSQGNRFLAPTNPFAMEVEVTKRIEAAQTTWNAWNWRSEGDLLLNGAYFIPSGAGAAASYAHASSLGAKSSSMVGTITSCAGVLSCRKGSSC